MDNIITDSNIIHHVSLNPNQRQFREDERRHREQLVHLKDEQKSSNKLYVKSRNIELDVDLLDKHDSFYHTTKSLLNLFQIMGVMPIMRSPPGSDLPRTTFHWCSKAFLWAYFIYAIETVMVSFVGIDRITRFLRSSDKKFDVITYNVIFISVLLPHFLLPVASWRNGSEVAKFKNMWTHYQLQFLRVTGTPIVFPNLYRLTWSLCFISWIASLVVILPQYFLQDDFFFWHTFAYYHILAMLNGFCSLWYINCTAFGTASAALTINVAKALQEPKSAQKINDFRHLWVDLSHMMQQLGRAYSNMYGIYCLIVFFTTIIATFGALSEILDNGATYKQIGLFIIVFYCMTLLFIICNEAHFASQKVGLDFQTRLLNVNLAAIDRSAEKEIEMFLIAIAKNPPIMNLDGYANINRELLTSNISFMATYLVVLFQFKLTSLRQPSSSANKMLASVMDKINATLIMIMNKDNSTEDAPENNDV